MELSYWEYQTWLSDIDFTIVGSGIVGLGTAIFIKEKYPKAKILVLEKGMLPQGASTKNAGFACFGSISELLSDLDTHSEEEVITLVAQRFKGIALLRSLVGDETLGFEKKGGHEVFMHKDRELFTKCHEKLAYVNQLVEAVFKKEVFELTKNKYGFEQVIPQYITHTEEGQIDTGKMMSAMLKLVRQKGIHILNSVTVEAYQDHKNRVGIKTDRFELNTRKMVVCTNGFASKILNEAVRPARAQVLVTKPMANLHIQGTFHLDQGYYYFRNVADRILFGGGRNLDFKAEETTEFGQTKVVQHELERLLKEAILPNKPFEIDRRWSGIMGVGQQKKPIVKQLSDNVYCGVRLGGMGVAIGSLIGKEIVDLIAM